MLSTTAAGRGRGNGRLQRRYGPNERRGGDSRQHRRRLGGPRAAAQGTEAGPEPAADRGRRGAGRRRRGPRRGGDGAGGGRAGGRPPVPLPARVSPGGNEQGGGWPPPAGPPPHRL